MNIPSCIHFVWLGQHSLHPNMERWVHRWCVLNPDWDVYRWSDKTGESSVTPVHLSGPSRQTAIRSSFTSRHSDLLRRACHLSQRSNIWRYEIVREFGGLYVDTDVEPFRPVKDLLENSSAVTCANPNDPSNFECAFMGAVRNHPWTVELCDRLTERDPRSSRSMGNSYFSTITLKHLDGFRSVTILAPNLIDFTYPNPWLKNLSGEGKSKADSSSLYARHHVSSQWYATGFQPLSQPAVPTTGEFPVTPTFTAELFTNNHIDTWNKHVVPLLEGVPRARWIEIGSYEGRSALWTLDHVLTGEDTTLVCVDVWEPLWTTPNVTESRFDENLKGRRNVVKFKGASRQVLPHLTKGSYHGAYIDGSHTEEDAYQDACQVLPLLHPGAVLIFDDYEGDLPPGKPQQFGVRQAVDRFLKEHPELVVVHRGWQIILRLPVTGGLSHEQSGLL